MKISVLPLLLLTVVSCNQAPPPQMAWQEIAGRDNTALYHARVPAHWQRTDIAPSADTTEPICEFTIDESVRVTVHNFPSDDLNDRIPPMAQVTRWKRQAQVTNPLLATTTPYAHGGFVGLQFECDEMLAWSLQLAAEHYQNLVGSDPHLRQRRADYTIKATGTRDALASHRSELVAFARSFELIEEIPSSR